MYRHLSNNVAHHSLHHRHQQPGCQQDHLRVSQDMEALPKPLHQATVDHLLERRRTLRHLLDLDHHLGCHQTDMAPLPECRPLVTAGGEICQIARWKCYAINMLANSIISA